MKIELLGGILAALLAGLGLGGDWDANDRAPRAADTRVCPESGPCAPHRPPPDEPRVCPDDGVCAPSRPAPPRVCPDSGPCAPYLPPPARRP